MIFPEEVQDGKAVAEHYDTLDPWYLKLWGEHVHHGLWKTGKETPELAVEQMVELVAEKAEMKGGEDVCDIGCGYGAPARVFSEKWGAKVTGFTLSKKQQEYARSKDPNSTYLLCDWFENTLPEKSFDVAISIESSEHMVDKARFFQEINRVLRPGGRFVTCAWLSKENPQPWEIKYLLEPICREGRLPNMGSVSDYFQLMKKAGFEKIQFEDLSSLVKKTWAICGWRTIKSFGDPDFRKFYFKEKAADRIFAKTIFRILAAYQTKSMIYGTFTAVKGPL